MVNVFGNLLLLLDFKLSDKGHIVTMHSNQLRGKAYNGNFFESYLLYNPKLMFFNDDYSQCTEVVFSSGSVGNNEIITPLSASLDKVIPGKEYNVQFQGTFKPNNISFKRLHHRATRIINLGKITLPENTDSSLKN